MTTLILLGGAICFGAGFALCWFFKDRIQALVVGANTLSARLHAKADALLKK